MSFIHYLRPSTGEFDTLEIASRSADTREVDHDQTVLRTQPQSRQHLHCSGFRPEAIHSVHPTTVAATSDGDPFTTQTLHATNTVAKSVVATTEAVRFCPWLPLPKRFVFVRGCHYRSGAFLSVIVTTEAMRFCPWLPLPKRCVFAHRSSFNLCFHSSGKLFNLFRW